MATNEPPTSPFSQLLCSYQVQSLNQFDMNSLTVSRYPHVLTGPRKQRGPLSPRRRPLLFHKLILRPFPYVSFSYKQLHTVLNYVVVHLGYRLQSAIPIMNLSPFPFCSWAKLRQDQRNKDFVLHHLKSFDSITKVLQVRFKKF